MQFFEWLCELVDPRNDFGNEFGDDLLWELFSIPYKPIIQMDKNREIEALQLRYIFGEERNSECSVLELLVSLSIHLERETDAPGYEHPIYDFFKMMIHNLGLCRDSSKEEINRAVSIFQERSYEYDGHGGNIFVLRNPPDDLRTTELWLQMTWYIHELM